MRRRILVLVGIVSVVLLAVAAAFPVAAYMGEHSSRPPNQPTSESATSSPPSQPTIATISLAQARTSFTQYLNQLGYDNLKISEVMQFSNQFYAEAVDSQSGAGAFEMVMDLNGSNVYPEPGPTMMWNTTYGGMFGSQGSALRENMRGYGMMGGCQHGYNDDSGSTSANDYGHGMMGGQGRRSNAAATPNSSTDEGWCGGNAYMGYHPETSAQLDQPLTSQTAQARVQSWLDQNHAGSTAADATAFPGYFTFHTEVNGEITGMLSIQSSTGAIWEHVWHGTFVAMDTAS